MLSAPSVEHPNLLPTPLPSLLPLPLLSAKFSASDLLHRCRYCCCCTAPLLLQLPCLQFLGS
jgi:hypothetical protein